MELGHHLSGVSEPLKRCLSTMVSPGFYFLGFVVVVIVVFFDFRVFLARGISWGHTQPCSEFTSSSTQGSFQVILWKLYVVSKD